MVSDRSPSPFTQPFGPMPISFRVAIVASCAAVLLFGCSTASQDRAAVESITDTAYLTASLWDDGEAEIAFYRVRRSRNQYGESEDQEFLVGTYLVKHDYDPEAEAKARPDAAGAVSAFKYALFYEFESGSYEYKRNHVVNARQSDLRPLKASFTSFDWCSNLYVEQTFGLDDRVDYLMRSDDYGNGQQSFDYEIGAFPPALVPLLVRGMDFEDAQELDFEVLLESGEVVSAIAERVEAAALETENGRYEAERIVVTYDGEVPSTFAEEADSVETYWRAAGEDRLLLAIEGASGRYEMGLIEAVRSPYWEENVYEELERVRTRP